MSWKRIFSRGAEAGDEPAPEEDPLEQARRVLFAYHRATKHDVQRYARGPFELDWATQPDPFRRWDGAESIPLAHPAVGPEPRYEEVFVEGTLTPRPLDRALVSQLFYDSLALSAWKRHGEARWALRVNPSSGNLHPTEGYLVAPAIAGLSETPLVAHYTPESHALEVRARPGRELWESLSADLPPGSVLVGLSSVHWREAWKYGERAYRYCNHDAGHAIACVTLAAAGMGWKATMLDGLGSEEVACLLGLGDTAPPEAEEPDCVLAVHPQGTTCAAERLDAELVGAFAELAWSGTPNELSPDHEDWEVIDLAADAAHKPIHAPACAKFEPSRPPLEIGDEPIPFRKIVRQRRSAVAMDGTSGLASDAFYQTLRRTLPGRGELPFSALPWAPRIHLALFVHRVADLEPGLYVLVRNPSDEPALRGAFRDEFSWERPPGCPDELPLFALHHGDVRGLAARISCNQDIAADGCFSLGMIARFASSLEEDGPWMYPRLFWESGVVGQVLYLEAEALGIASTGIGCFFDDSMHGVLGVTDHSWQSLYHFTTGGAVEDVRVQSDPAYPNETA